MSKLCILGAGSWGTALSIALGTRFESISLWSRDSSRAASIELMRENTHYLPGFLLPSHVSASADLQSCLEDASFVLFVTPAQSLRQLVRDAAPLLSPSVPLISASKGIEERNFCRMTEVISQELTSAHRVAALSGPTFARGVAAGEPAAMVVACQDLQLTERVQHCFATPELRLYANTDVVGVELGAALKNIVAIGAGLCSGLGLGSNSIAALVTRGLAEISRFAVFAGGQQRTLSGLAGLGDLVLTATGEQSRNRQVGVELGRGIPLSTILARMTMVAEGVATCRAAFQIGQQRQLDLPIITAVYQVLYEGKHSRLAIRELMDRPLTVE